MRTKLLATAALLAAASSVVYPPAPALQLPPQERQSQQEREIQDRQIKEANKKRQQDIRDETTKLFQLATELKAAVDKTNENMLSLDVVRKADEVEKLAKKVKEKMKEAIGPNPILPRPVATPPIRLP